MSVEVETEREHDKNIVIREHDKNKVIKFVKSRNLHFLTEDVKKIFASLFRKNL